MRRDVISEPGADVVVVGLHSAGEVLEDRKPE